MLDRISGGISCAWLKNDPEVKAEKRLNLNILLSIVHRTCCIFFHMVEYNKFHLKY